ncbi:MAG: ABC transporter ATP-binding protein [Ruminococcaceae bacterium]|nr:ABC transporter ATP-binding protein [Oscillospiraceae bacterium]
MLEFLHTDVIRASHMVLSDITFSLPPKTLTALIGKNGCGKSTLISAVMGDTSYTGSIRLLSEELSSLSARARAQRAAILPQTLAAPHMTVRELVFLGRSPHLSPLSRASKKDTDAVEQALADVGICALRDRYLDELSGGERQKAYLAMIVAQGTPLLILDEPTTYMDLAFSHHFMKSLVAWKEAHEKTLLIAMHDLNLAVRYADRLLLLDAGKQIFYGSVKDCLETNVIERTFALERINADGNVFFIGS